MKLDRRSAITIGLTVAIVVLFNVSILDRARLIASGEPVFLIVELSEERSFLQGDYMQLRFAVERDAAAEPPGGHVRRGYLVLRLNYYNVARFDRFHAGEPLTSEERLVRFHRRSSQFRVVPDAFFFQQGHAELYEDAHYGVFKFDDRGRYILVGLADRERTLIEP